MAAGAIYVRKEWGSRNRTVQHHGRSQNQGNSAVSIGKFARSRYGRKCRSAHSGAQPSACDHSQQNHIERFRRLGAGTWPLFSEQVGCRLDADFIVQRSERRAARWRLARRQVRQRFLYLHELLLVSTIASRRSRSVPVVCKHGVARKMSIRDNEPDARSWRKAYGLALSLFVLEVALLYLFTIRLL